MATRSQGRCVNLPDDDYLDTLDAGIFHHQNTDNVVEALATGVSSIPLRIHAALVPIMPPETTEFPLQPHSPPPSPTPVRVSQKGIKPLTSRKPSDQYSKESTTYITSSLAPEPLIYLPLRASQEDATLLTSRKSSKQSSKEPATSIPLLFPPSTPPTLRIVPKDTKPSTSGNQSGKESNATSALPLPTGLPTPDKTPRNCSRRKEIKAEVKLELSPSPEIVETSRQVTELQSKLHVATESTEKSATNIAPLPPAGLLTPVNTPPLARLGPLRHRKEARESDLSDETALGVAEIPETYYHERNTSSPVFVLSTKAEGSQHRQFKDTVTSPTTKLEYRCCCTAFQGPCIREVNSAHLHKPASDSPPITPKSVLRNGIAKRSSVECKVEIPIAPKQLTDNTVYCPSSFLTGVGGVLLEHVDDRQFKVKRPGRKDVFVAFCDHIPPYLQPDTQKKLRAAITKTLSGRDKVPGYVYALNINDLRREGKLILKIGYSGDVKRRHAEWKRQCPSYIGDIRGCWPGQQYSPGLMAAHVERLVHIELADLARHAPYLRPNFPNINYTDVPPLEQAKRVPCTDCISPKTGRGTEHREIFSFRRAGEGVILGREWEYIIEPVIRRWGLFVMKYFAEPA